MDRKENGINTYLAASQPGILEKTSLLCSSVDYVENVTQGWCELARLLTEERECCG